MSTICHNPCLPSVFEFLSLSEKAALGRVSRLWHSTSRSSLCTVLDTVGFSLSVSQILALIAHSAPTVTIIRVSVREQEVDEFFSEFSRISLPSLSELCVLASCPKSGSTLYPVELPQLEQQSSKHYSQNGISFFVQYDPAEFPQLQAFLRSRGECISSIGFLRGCAKFLPSTSEMKAFLESLPHARLIHLGDCSSFVDWDELVPYLGGGGRLQWFQSRNASASLETIQLAARHIRHCDFGCPMLLLLFML